MRKACFLLLAIVLSVAATGSQLTAADGECFTYWVQTGEMCDYAQTSCDGTCNWANEGGFVFHDVSTCECVCCVSYEQ